MIEEVSQNFTVFPETVEIDLGAGLLRLRPPCAQDAEAISVALSDESVARHLGALPCPPDDRSLGEYLNFLVGSDQVSKVIELNGEFAGIISLSTQLTFWVVRKFWRQGVASSAVRWVVETHFKQSSGRSVIAEVHPSNLGSILLLEKLGFAASGRLKRRFSFVSETTERFAVYELTHFDR
ncbi:GNAT family N-acetyltransferase [Roseibium sp. MMSF_3544]|uniref:GNAT family N-acetyltransferase n=1 Tax=unclassified Roseibium TaxID=2629323 RepID=UPI00273E1665|nr:GNAT family N-acetyltransferase [Roseibium sp. MMSF_3544]